MNNNSQLKQSFYYRGEVYKYRIQEASLMRYKRETGNSILSEIKCGGEHLAAVLYYCVCWCGKDVSRQEFVTDWKIGNVFMRPGAKREYQTSGIIRLIRKAVKDYRIE